MSDAAQVWNGEAASGCALAGRWQDLLRWLGFEPGSAVVTMLPNCTDVVALWGSARQFKSTGS